MSRMKHSALPTYLLGGVTGAAVNLGTFFFLGRYAGLEPSLAFGCGVVLNLWYHRFYYYVLYANSEISIHGNPWVRTALELGLAALSIPLFMHVRGWVGGSVPWAALSTIGVLSALSGLFIRNTFFASARLAQVEYQKLDPDYYEQWTDAERSNGISAWFHTYRRKAVHEQVRCLYHKGMTVADFGCGNCLWNEDKLPVLGLDVNKGMLTWAKKQGRLAKMKVTPDLTKTGLKPKSLDLVVMTEVLEHIPDYQAALAEIKRVLKPGGRLVLTVPYDIFLGPFFILFNLHCTFRWLVKGDLYYKYRCGHVNHFTVRRLRKALVMAGFVVEEMSVLKGLTLRTTALKWEPRKSLSLKQRTRLLGKLEMNLFQEKCVLSVNGYLMNKMGLKSVRFVVVKGRKQDHLKAKFETKNKGPVEMYIYDDEAGFAVRGGDWYMCEKPDYDSEDDLINGFVSKLDKFMNK